MEVLVPKENNNDQVVMISKLYGSSGDFIEEGADLIEFETSKTAVVLEAPCSGYITFLHGVGDEVEVNSVVCVIAAEQLQESDNVDLAMDVDIPSSTPTGDVFFSNKASVLDQAEASLDGKFWVTSRMLSPRKNISSESPSVVAIHRDEGIVSRGLNDNDLPDITFTTIKSSMRKRAEIASLRVSGAGEFQSTIGVNIQAGTRIVPSLLFGESLQDLLCFEACLLLKNDFKELNSFYISDREVGVYSHVIAGISLDISNNLTVAAVPATDSLSLPQLQDNLTSLFLRFETSELSQDDLKPTTFTISDLSATGASYILPLLNGAQSLILGVVRDNTEGYKIYATFDHRVTAGLVIAKFLDELALRVSSYFDGTSLDVTSCSYCGLDVTEAEQHDRHGLLKITTSKGTADICWGCFNG